MAVTTAVSCVAVVCVFFEPRGRNETPSAKSVPGSVIVGSAELRKRELFAYLSLSRLPHYLPSLVFRDVVTWLKRKGYDYYAGYYY